jgi:UDP-N-acetylglucosamine acyltransferase
MKQIHPTAIIAPEAVLGDDVDIGPYCVVGPDVKLGTGTRLVAHVVVDGHTTLGEGCEVHPFARLGGKTQDLKYSGGTTYVEVGDRTVLRECVTVNSGTRDGEVTRVGPGCLLMAYCHVAHGCVLGNGVIVSNGTQFAGEVQVEDRAIISGLVAVHQFCRIGTMSMVGGSLKLTQDVPPYMLVDGPDPKVHGVNLVGLTRRGFSEETRNALKQAHRLLFRSEINVGEALARIEAELPDMPEIRHLVGFYRSSNRGVTR